MTLLVRDEEDILESNICFHLNSGVDFIVAIDNWSIDKTPNILEKYQRKGLLSYEIVKEHTYEQSKWVSSMAVKARSMGATHIFHCDADEFWYPKSGNLKDYLPTKNEIFYVSLLNYLPPKIHLFSSIAPRLVVVKPGNYPSKNPESSKLLLYKYPRKVLTPSRFDQVAMGNHDVVTDGKVAKIELDDKIIIHHFSIRGFNHFKRKVVNGGSAYAKNPDQNPSLGWHWKKWHKLYLDNKLELEYESICLKNESDGFIRDGIVRWCQIPKRIALAKKIFVFENLFNSFGNGD